MSLSQSASEEGSSLRRCLISLVMAMAVLIPIPAAARQQSVTATPPAGLTERRGIFDGFDSVGGFFIENRGQVTDGVRYYSRGNPAVAFRDEGVTFVLADDRTIERGLSLIDDPIGRRASAVSLYAYHLKFDGANLVAPEGRSRLSFDTNFFLGNDSAKWRTSVPVFSEVAYPNLYDGIDLTYRQDRRGVKYEFVVKPGADPGVIRMRYEGAESVTKEQVGMAVHTRFGDVIDANPYSYQEDGMVVGCAFVARGALSYGFDCEGRDISRPLVIDPLVYSTFLGGDDDEMPWDIAMDATGNAYVVGFTKSYDFPVTPGAFDVLLNKTDGFIAKLNPDGSSLAWATFLGGSDVEWVNGITVDPLGDVYIVGDTGSTDFPATAGALDTSFSGFRDAFVARFAGDGMLKWATYLGGTESEQGYAIVLDGSGNVVVAGSTFSPDFPVTPGAFDVSYDGYGDGYIAKLNSAGSLLLWSTFLGGSGYDQLPSIALGADDSIYAAGTTNSTDFPVTPGAFDVKLDGDADCFVAKLSPGGNALVWATYLGGAGTDSSGSIILDSRGDIYLTGGTASLDFPVTPGAFDTTFNGWSDAFIAKLDSTGGDLMWATFLGGSDLDGGNSIALNVDGDVIVAGGTRSSDFPVTPGAFDTTLSGTYDGFLARLDPDGTSLLYATFFGGSSYDCIIGIVLDSSGYVYLTGYTSSADFPVTPGAFDVTYNGGSAGEGDAFVAKFGPVGPANTPPVLAWTGEPNYVSDGLDPETGTVFTDFTYRVAYYDADNNPPSQIKVRIEKPLGNRWVTSLMSIDGWIGTPDNYMTGAIYSFTTRLFAGTNYWYYFQASDGWAWASGPPTIPIDAPDVVADNPPVAVAKASPTSAFIGDTITFDATASTDDLGIASYLWDFGDSSTGTNPVTTHSYTSHGTFLATLTVWDTANQSDTDTVSISIGNRQPVADAGPDQSVNKNDLVTLSGTGSSDPDGDPLTYAWNQTSGPSIVLAGADTATPTFSPAVSGTYSFLLAVEDGWGGSSDDAVNVTVLNRAPIADAGPDQIVPKKALVTLDGRASSDPDNDTLTFAWVQTGGLTVFPSGVDTANPTFTPPRSGLYTFRLTIDDGDGGVSSDTVQVTATNQPPTANAGADRAAQKNTLVTLDGSLSSDPDGDALTLAWTQVSGNSATLTGADTVTPTFTPTKAGTCVFSLHVDDGDGGVSDDTVTVTVWGLPPIADLVASPPAAKVGEMIGFDATASTDPDGTIVDFSFTFGDNSSASGTEAVRNHPYASAGTYTVTLKVTDDDGNTSMAQVIVEVISLPPPPSVEANYKPVVAVIFAVILAVAGAWSSKRRPWKGGKDGKAVARAFMIASMPFILAEASTGVFSFLTGQLAMPPLFGAGSAVDIAILVAGLLVSVLRVRERKRARTE